MRAKGTQDQGITDTETVVLGVGSLFLTGLGLYAIVKSLGQAPTTLGTAEDTSSVAGLVTLLPGL